LTGELFITEHGPSQDDEVNLLEPGKNYGWPMVTGTSGSAKYSAQYMDPVLALTPTIAIAGAAFYSEGMLPSSWNGSLFFTALKGSHLQRVTLEPPEYREVLTREILYKGELGRLRAVSMSPDGHLYLTTSNRDGRGSPRSEDDRLLRLVPSLPRHLTQLQEPAGEPFRLELPPGDYLLRLQAPGLAHEERRVTVVADVTVDLGLVEMGEEVR
jgi:glucose/arabinose dehydrogenase